METLNKENSGLLFLFFGQTTIDAKCFLFLFPFTPFLIHSPFSLFLSPLLSLSLLLSVALLVPFFIFKMKKKRS